jgi:hypothetical protein
MGLCGNREHVDDLFLNSTGPREDLFEAAGVEEPRLAAEPATRHPWRTLSPKNIVNTRSSTL